MATKSREFYLNSIEPGVIVAFKNGERMYSGKVQEIANGKVTIKTKNCSIYFVDISDIVWVKNGSIWPVGIYNALKFSKEMK